MNYAGKFDAKLSVEGSGLHSDGPVHVETVHAAHVPSDAIIIPDAHLLFNGEFKRSGVDLILSKDAQELVLHDYFKGEKRAALASPDGARLTGDIVNALSGHVEYAQADGSASVSKIIGHVTKLVGTATAIRNGVSIILNNGDNVEKGDVVESGADSRLGITFIDGTVFGLSSNARMVLNEMVYDPNGSNNSSLLSLVSGTMTFVAGDTAKHGDMKIDTPVATMGIRGTAVLVQIDFVAPKLAPGVVPDPGSLQALLPELHVQVVVEPDGTVGSLIMYEKSTLTPLAVADKAGVQINITNGIVSQSSNPLSPELQKLIDEVFTLRFTDNSNTKTTVVQNDSIVPKDGTFGFHLPDGTLPIFTALANKSSINNDPNNTPTIFFIPKVALDQPTAKQGMPIHATGGGTNSFAWQVSSDNGKDWTTVGTDATYTPTENDEGKLLQLVVNNASQTFSLGVVQETPDLVATLDRTTAQQDVAIHVTNVADGGNTVTTGITYNWEVSDGHGGFTTVGTNASFAPTEADEGKTLQLVVTYADAAGNESTTTNFGVVQPVAEPPTLTIASHTVSIAEETGTALGISVTAHDGDDVLSISISNVPSDATLTYLGADNHIHTLTPVGGVYTLTVDQLNGLTLNAGEQAGPVTLSVTVTNTTTGETASVNDTISLTVNPIQENPIFGGSTATAANEEGGVVTLGASVATHDADDGAISVTITGLAHDLSTFNGGSYDSESGTWSGTAAEFNALTFKAGEDGTQHLTITATTSGAEAGATVESYTLTVNPIQENPIFSGAVTTVASEQGGVVTLGASVATHDADDGAISVTITGLAHDLSTFNGGSYDSESGTWSGTAAEFNALTFKAGEDGTQHLTITATTSGTEAGSMVENYTLTVNPIQENPIFSGAVTTAANEEGGVVTLGASVATHDADDGAISVTITGLAHDLSAFNGGSYDSESGTWSGTAAQFNALTFKAGEDGTQHLTITATTSGAEAGATVESYTLTVNPIQENPIFGGSTATSVNDEGGVVTLGATVATHDADDGAISVTITGLAHDLSTFNGGSYDSESGTWSGTAAQFNALSFKAGENGTQHLTITATTSGAEAGSTIENYTLTVNAVQENPIFGGSTATSANEEGGVVTLGATVATHDADDGAISVTITGLAHDLSTFNGGSYDSESGTWSGTAAEFNALTFKAGEDGTQHLTITATTSGAEAGSTIENYTLTVNAVQENPIFGGSTATSANEEGGVVTLGATVATHDADDGAISVTITGLAHDLSTFNGGSYDSESGTWSGTAAEFNALTFKAGEDGTQHLTITATTSGAEAGATVENYTLTVNPIQENPIFSGAVTTAASEQGGVVTLGASVATHDADDGAISVTITGLAHDLSTFNGGSYTAATGTWTGTAAEFNALTFKAGEDGTQHLTITATTSGAEAGATVESYTLTVNPIQENPIFSGAVTTAASEQGGVVTLGASVATHDADDGAISVTITGLAHDLSTFNGGSYTAATGTWTGTAAEFNALSFKAGEDGTQHLTITATTSGAEAGATVENYTLTVNPIQENPIFSGAVTTAASEQGGVVTLGASVATHDADDGAISVTITGLAHDLSTFNGGSYTAATGTWTGTAAEFNALTFKAGEDGTQHLTITATTSGAEAGATVESYTLTVNPVAEAASLASTVTVVSGESDNAIPLTIVATPFDSDDNLSIQITGVPSDATLTYVGADNSTHTLTPVGGVYTLTPAQLNGLQFHSDEGNSILHVVVTSSEGTSSTTSSVDIAVSVDSSLTIAAGDTFHLNGGTLTDHSITVDGTLIGFGTVTASNGALANIIDNGLIEASSSHSLDLNANITGNGTLELTNNTSMEIVGSVSSTLKTLFAIGAGSIGELILDDPKDFHAPVTGFGGNDIIDLKHLAYSGSTSTVLDSTHASATVGAETISLSMTSTQTVITVSESGTTSTITLQGNYTGHSFTFSSDGSGGTQFVDPLAIDSGAALELSGASADNVLFVNHADISGTLVLDDATAFTGQISGFAGTSTTSDAIDLKNITFDSETQWTYTASSAGTGGALTIYEGATVVDTIEFTGNYTTANFNVQSDGNGGTLVTDPPTSSPAVSSVIMHDPGPPASSTIAASAPNQTLSGLAASDTFVFDFTDVGHATVTDFHPDFDMLQFKSPIFANAQAALNATHDDGLGNTVVAIDSHDTITLAGVLKAQLHASDFHIV